MRSNSTDRLALTPLPRLAEGRVGFTFGVAPVSSDVSTVSLLRGTHPQPSPVRVPSMPGLDEVAPVDRVDNGLTERDISSLGGVVVACRNAEPSFDLTVTFALSLIREGGVDGDIRLVSSGDGTQRECDAAVDAVRRSILGCQRDGYPPPLALFDLSRMTL